MMRVLYILFNAVLLTILNSCNEQISVYEGQWINNKGEVLTIKQLDEMNFMVKGCLEIKKTPLYITGEESFTAFMGNDGKLYIGNLCTLTMKDEQLILQYFMPFNEEPFVYEKAETINKENERKR